MRVVSKTGIIVLIDVIGSQVERQSDGSVFHAEFLLDELEMGQKAKKYRDAVAVKIVAA